MRKLGGGGCLYIYFWYGWISKQTIVCNPITYNNALTRQFVCFVLSYNNEWVEMGVGVWNELEPSALYIQNFDCLCLFLLRKTFEFGLIFDVLLIVIVSRIDKYVTSVQLNFYCFVKVMLIK